MPKKHVTIPIFVPHYGCPHICAFCNQWTVSNTQSVPDHIETRNKIINFLKTIPSTTQRIEIAFFGGSFTGIAYETQKSLLSAATEFITNKSVNAIRVSTRPDYINTETLQLLKQYNVTTIELGVQSFDDKVLKKAHRGHDSKSVLKAITLIKTFDFQFVIQLMPGLPGDTIETSINNARTATECKPNGVRIYPTIVFKNTQLEKLYNDKKYTPLTLEETIEYSKEMTLIFEQSNIPILRLGIHPMSKKNMDDIIAGPYHPSLGFFVKARIKRDILQHKINQHLLQNNIKAPGLLHLTLPFKEKEEFIGFKKENIFYLENLFNIKHINYDYHDGPLTISGFHHDSIC